MTDDDLIRRGDALNAIKPIYGWSITAAEGVWDAIAALPAQGVKPTDAIKMGFLSAAPGEWRIGDIERVTNAILAALAPAEAGGVEAQPVAWRQEDRCHPGWYYYGDAADEAIPDDAQLLYAAPAPVDALVKAAAKDAREVFEDYGSKAREAIDYMEQVALAAIREGRT